MSENVMPPVEEPPQYPEPTLEPAAWRPRKMRRWIIGLAVVGFAVGAAALGLMLAVTGGGDSGPTPIQKAVAACHAPKYWMGDKGHSLLVDWDDASLVSEQQINQLRCTWGHLGMPDATRSRLVDMGSQISMFHQTTRGSVTWPGYRAEVSVSIAGDAASVSFIVTER